MRALIVDAGNTNLKLAIFEDGKLKFLVISSYAFLERLMVPDYDVGILVSTVKSLNPILLRIFPGLFVLSPKELKIKSEYSLDLVGADRIAGCYPFIRSGRDAIIVISGTSITINVVKNEVFYGGPILPPFSNIRRAYGILAIERIRGDTERAINSAIEGMFNGGLETLVGELKKTYKINQVFVSGDLPYKIRGAKRIEYPVIFGAYQLLLDTLEYPLW